MDESVEDGILRLRAEENWEEIIEKFDRNRFLPWVWPDRKNLEFIGKSVRNQNLNSLISVGCGSGLLEWLLASATGMDVTGIETDGSWWKSKYSSGTFVPTIFAADPRKGEFGVDTRNSALLFCYFNNLEAFMNYINNYKGDCLIGMWCKADSPGQIRLGHFQKLYEKGSLFGKAQGGKCPVKRTAEETTPKVVGPGPGRGTYAIPEPFNLPEGLEENWKLSGHQEIRSSKDFIAVYVRK